MYSHNLNISNSQIFQIDTTHLGFVRGSGPPMETNLSKHNLLL